MRRSLNDGHWELVAWCDEEGDKLEELDGLEGELEDELEDGMEGEGSRHLEGNDGKEDEGDKHDNRVVVSAVVVVVV